MSSENKTGRLTKPRKSAFKGQQYWVNFDDKNKKQKSLISFNILFTTLDYC